MEKINIAEILKDCPQGMELDCTLFNKPVKFDGIDKDYNLYPIRVKIEDNIKWFDEYGCIYSKTYAKCVIFPKGKNTWEGFVPPCIFKDGDVVINKNNVGNWIGIFHNHCYDKYAFSCYCYLRRDGSFTNVSNTHDYPNTRLATKEEEQILFDAIKENGYRWNSETKTLEKLVTDKFDITTLKPFDKVLVRDKSNEVWTANFYSHYDATSDKPFICVGWSEMNEYSYCIPYEVNKELLGTTNDCGWFYKNWEEE